MKLRQRKKGEARDPTICSVSRCNAEPMIILATGELDDCDVHFCDKHWQQHCAEQDAERETERVEAEKATNPKLPLGLRPGRYNFRYTDDLQLEVIP